MAYPVCPRLPVNPVCPGLARTTQDLRQRLSRGCGQGLLPEGQKLFRRQRAPFILVRASACRNASCSPASTTSAAPDKTVIARAMPEGIEVTLAAAEEGNDCPGELQGNKEPAAAAFNVRAVPSVAYTDPKVAWVGLITRWASAWRRRRRTKAIMYSLASRCASGCSRLKSVCDTS
jgi:hypothetical protein